MKQRILTATAACLMGLAGLQPLAQASAADVLHVYGPGGPAPAMREAAATFGREHGVDVQVTAGPTPAWEKAMQQDGDLVYSGSEAMMSDFLTHFPTLDASTVQPLYLRPAGILVRPGNPHHIQGFRDLLKPGVKIMVVNGAGQVGLWEDVAGRDGDMRVLRDFRSHVGTFAANSSEALQQWQKDTTIDAWLIFPIWSIAHPGQADVIPLEAKYRLYRDCGVAFTRQGENDATAKAFVAFLAGPEGKKIFEKYGWYDHAPQ